MNIKFMYNGIKIDGKLYGGHWSFGSNIVDKDCITFYSKGYERMPNFGMPIENNSDIMTDYFEEDRLRFMPSSPYYLQAMESFNMQQVKREAKHNRYLVRNGVEV